LPVKLELLMEFHEPDWCQVLGRVEKRLFHTFAWGLFAACCVYLWHEAWIDQWFIFPLPEEWRDENTWAVGLQAGAIAASYLLSYLLLLLLFAGLPRAKDRTDWLLYQNAAREDILVRRKAALQAQKELQVLEEVTLTEISSANPSAQP
jgi:hypothetical protein